MGVINHQIFTFKLLGKGQRTQAHQQHRTDPAAKNARNQ